MFKQTMIFAASVATFAWCAAPAATDRSMRVKTPILAIVSVMIMLTALAASGAPNAADLGVPIYLRAKHDEELSRFFGKTLAPITKIYAAFTTTDSVEKVAEFYQKNTKRPAGTLGFSAGKCDFVNFLTSHLDDFTGAARKKVEGLIKASSDKQHMCAVQSDLGSQGNVSVAINRPHLNPKGDLVDETLIEIIVLKT